MMKDKKIDKSISLEELDIINRARAGDRDALHSLILDNYSILQGYVIKMTGNKETAHDVINDTIVRATCNISKYKPQGKFSSWLLAIATNIYRDSLKREKKYVSTEGLEIVNACSSEEEALLRLQLEEVLKCLKELPYEKRAVFILKHYYNYSYEEISKILKCPIGTVRSRLHYSIELLSKKLNGRKD